MSTFTADTSDASFAMTLLMKARGLLLGPAHTANYRNAACTLVEHAKPRIKDLRAKLRVERVVDLIDSGNEDMALQYLVGEIESLANIVDKAVVHEANETRPA